MLPEAFSNRMKDQLGEEYPAFLESLRQIFQLICRDALPDSEIEIPLPITKILRLVQLRCLRYGCRFLTNTIIQRNLMKLVPTGGIQIIIHDYLRSGIISPSVFNRGIQRILPFQLCPLGIFHHFHRCNLIVRVVKIHRTGPRNRFFRAKRCHRHHPQQHRHGQKQRQ